MFDIIQSLWVDFLSIYDGLCILLAMFLFYKVDKGYRDIAFFVLCFFVVSDVFYQYFFLDIRNSPGNGWIIFLIYNIINVSIILKIKDIASSTFISDVLKVNVLLNIVVSYYFISNSVSDVVYNMYAYPAGVLMVLCLFFLWMVSYGSRLCNSKANNTGFICNLLGYCLRDRGGSGVVGRIQTQRPNR